MAYLKVGEIRSMAPQDRRLRLRELRQELMHERGVAAMGGSPPSPGKIRQLRRQIARILTIEREDQLGLARAPRSRGARAPPGPAKASAKAVGSPRSTAKEA